MGKTPGLYEILPGVATETVVKVPTGLVINGKKGTGHRLHTHLLIGWLSIWRRGCPSLAGIWPRGKGEPGFTLDKEEGLSKMGFWSGELISASLFSR